MVVPRLSFLSAQQRSDCCLINEYDDDDDDDDTAVFISLYQLVTSYSTVVFH